MQLITEHRSPAVQAVVVSIGVALIWFVQAGARANLRYVPDASPATTTPQLSNTLQRSGMNAVLLNNGVKMPRLGLGTYLASGGSVRDGVRAALNLGIRAIDTASLYRNEADVMAAIREAGVRREDVFITSKVAPFQQGTARATAAVEASLEIFGYVDLMLIHWPGVSGLKASSPANAVKRLETWRVLEDMQQQGRCKAIGVSNFEERHLTELVSLAKVQPAANQIEVHPRLPQHQLRAACQQLNVSVIAYSPFGAEGAELLRHKTVLAVAQAVNKSPAQVLLQWSLQQGNIVIPKSVQEKHIRDWGVDQPPWELEDASMKALDSMNDSHRYLWNPTDVA